MERHRAAPRKAYKKKRAVKKPVSAARSRNAASGKSRSAHISGAAAPVIHVAPVTEAYSHAILNPAEAPPCGMPVGGIPSDKSKCWIRGRMSTGTTGAGYILVSPAAAMASDGNSCYYTTSAWVTANMTAVSGGGVALANTNAQFALANYGNGGGVKSRLVGCEIRVRYIGTELNRGGEAIVYCEPNHNSMVTPNLYQDTQMLANPSAGRCPITMTDWISCKYAGVVDPTEESYTATPTTPANTKNANYCMAIWINSAVAAQPFDFEVWAIYETIGSLVGGAPTPSMVDAVGHAAVNSAAQLAQVTSPGDHGSQEFFSRAAETIITAVSTSASGPRTAAAPAAVAQAQAAAHTSIVTNTAPKTSGWATALSGVNTLLHNPTFQKDAIGALKFGAMLL